jgi:hypothetical protein
MPVTFKLGRDAAAGRTITSIATSTIIELTIIDPKKKGDFQKTER